MQTKFKHLGWVCLASPFYEGVLMKKLLCVTSFHNPLHLSSIPHPSLSADSWPDTLLDSAAREALDWTPHYDIMIRDIGEIVQNEKKRQNLT